VNVYKQQALCIYRRLKMPVKKKVVQVVEPGELNVIEEHIAERHSAAPEVKFVERRVVVHTKRLDAFKFGVSGGILGALFVVLLTLFGMYEMFSWWTSLVLDMYGFLGYNLSALGIFLGAIYAFIECFICFGLFAVVYNWLVG
jgi:hypothetical protein